jgi:hypothetical protein
MKPARLVDIFTYDGPSLLYPFPVGAGLRNAQKWHICYPRIICYDILERIIAVMCDVPSQIWPQRRYSCILEGMWSYRKSSKAVTILTNMKSVSGQSKDNYQWDSPGAVSGPTKALVQIIKP